MKLALFTNQFPGRVNTFLARDVRVLIEQGFDVDIFSIYPHEPDNWQFVPDLLDEHIFPRHKTHHAQSSHILRINPLRGRDFSRWLGDTTQITRSAMQYGRGPLLKSLYVMPQAWAWAQQYKDQYDHVLAYWGNFAATCAYAFHRLMQRDDVPFSMYLHAGMDLYRDQVYLLEKLQYADNIFVVCEFNRQFVRQLYPQHFETINPKIHLHHLGLDLQQMPYTTANRATNRIVSVGRFAENKGVQYTVRAVGELVKQGINVELELVGDGDERTTYERIAADYGITDRLHITGWLPFEQVQTRIQQATILVHASTQIGDAVPTVIKEAMALGTPVIGTQVAGIPELLDDGRCGVIVPPKDDTALQTAIHDLLRDETRRNQLARDGRQFAETTFDMWVNGKTLADRLRTTTRKQPT